MKRFLTLTAFASTALLAACGQPTEPAPDTAAPAEDAAMAPMAPTPAAQTTGHGTGVVTAVDPAAGTVTLDHGPIPEAGWPAMTMGFKADPALLATVKTGDRVRFDLVIKGGTSEITAIRPE